MSEPEHQGLERARRVAKSALGTAYRRLEPFVRRAQPEAVLVADAQGYWNGEDRLLRQNAHVRGAGIFTDDTRWLAIGRRHVEMYETLARVAGGPLPERRVVEWGCGGGTNLVAFAPHARTYVGIDISRDALAACEAEAAGLPAVEFVPVLLDASRPEAALDHGRGSADLFLTTYVLELVPTPAYGLRVMAIAAELLAPGGLAFVQIKHSTSSRSSRPRPWDYRRNLASNTTYAIEDFWDSVREIGLDPLTVSLIERDELTDDGPYAYFLLRRR